MVVHDGIDADALRALVSALSEVTRQPRADTHPIRVMAGDVTMPLMPVPGCVVRLLGTAIDRVRLMNPFRGTIDVDRDLDDRQRDRHVGFLDPSCGS